MNQIIFFHKILQNSFITKTSHDISLFVHHTIIC